MKHMKKLKLLIKEIIFLHYLHALHGKKGFSQCSQWLKMILHNGCPKSARQVSRMVVKMKSVVLKRSLIPRKCSAPRGVQNVWRCGRKPMRPMGLIGLIGPMGLVSKMSGRGCPKCAGGGVQDVREGMSKMSGRGCPRCPGGGVQDVQNGCKTEKRCAEAVSNSSEMWLYCRAVRIGRGIRNLPLRERALHRKHYAQRLSKASERVMKIEKQYAQRLSKVSEWIHR